ncbi:unnamed protein product [Chrysoparadoxa australica]
MLQSRYMMGRGAPTGHSGDEHTWWSEIQPVTVPQQEKALQICKAPAGGGEGAHWTRFETTKLEVSQQVLGHCVTFLRVRAHLFPLEPLDFSQLGEVLAACVKVYQIQEGKAQASGDGMITGGGPADGTSAAAITGYEFLSASTSYIVEGLLAALYDLVSATKGAENARLSAALMPSLEALINETKPFLSRAARRIMEKLSAN